MRSRALVTFEPQGPFVVLNDSFCARDCRMESGVGASIQNLNGWI